VNCFVRDSVGSTPRLSTVCLGIVRVESEGVCIEECMECAGDIGLSCADVNDADVGRVEAGEASREEVGYELGHARDLVMFFGRNTVSGLWNGYG